MVEMSFLKWNVIRINVVFVQFFLTDFNSSINASEREGDLLIRERTQSES